MENKTEVRSEVRKLKLDRKFNEGHYLLLSQSGDEGYTFLCTNFQLPCLLFFVNSTKVSSAVLK